MPLDALFFKWHIYPSRGSLILLLGGDKTGANRWYEEHVPRADALYDEYLRDLKEEGLI